MEIKRDSEIIVFHSCHRQFFIDIIYEEWKKKNKITRQIMFCVITISHIKARPQYIQKYVYLDLRV